MIITGIGKKIKKYGYKENNYKKIIVSWGSTMEAKKLAHEKGIELISFKEILIEIAKKCSGETTYFSDDTFRTIQLFDIAKQIPDVTFGSIYKD